MINSITPTQANPATGADADQQTASRRTKVADNHSVAVAAEQRQLLQKQRNLEILEANRNATLTVADQPLSLVYQAAIDAINAELEPTLGAKALQRGQQQGIDVSPEATADRILALTTGLFGRYQAQRPELSEAEQVKQFTEVIAGGVAQGFAEARDILEGLQVLEGDIATNIDKTYALVESGLSDWREQQLSALADTGADDSDTGAG